MKKTVDHDHLDDGSSAAIGQQFFIQSRLLHRRKIPALDALNIRSGKYPRHFGHPGFGLNLAVLQGLRAVLPVGDLARVVAQLCAMGSYTVTLFLLSRYWVFAAARSSGGRTR